MKKKALKSISIICVLAMLISMCPGFNAIAWTDLSELTAEKLAVSSTAGNQVPDSIVADLTLPTDGITWTSSNSSVISEQGAVTRPVLEDASVTLTADNGIATKDFDFVVKSKKTNVVLQDSFCYEGLENDNLDTDIFAQMNSWSNVATTMTTASQIKTDADANKYLEIGFNTTGGSYAEWGKPVTSSKVKLDFDIMLTTFQNSGNAGYVTALINGTYENGEAVSSQVRLAHISPDGWLYWGLAQNNADFIRLDSSKMLPASIEIDLENKTVTGSLIGGINPGYTGDTCTEPMTGYLTEDTNELQNEGITYTSVSWVRILSNGSENVAIDNIVLSAEAEVSAAALNFEMLTTETPKSVTENLDFTVANELIEEMGGTINWESSDDSVLEISGDEGIITRPDSESADVTLTAVVEKDGRTTKEFTFKVISSKINVVAQESFSYDGLENPSKNTDIFASMDGWSNVASPMTTASQIKTDANGNKYAEFGLNATGGADIQWSKLVKANKVKIDFDITINTGISGTSYITAMLNGTKANGDPVNAEIYLSVISSDTWLYWGKANNNGDAIKLDASKMLPLSIEFDMANKTLSSSLIGGLRQEYQDDVFVDAMEGFTAADVSALDDEGNTFTSISKIRFYSNGSPSLSVDNFVLTAEKEVTAAALNFEMLTTQTPKAITRNLDLTSANELIEGMGGTINWESSDDSVLAISEDEAIITRPESESETITLTATVEHNGKTTTKEFTFTVAARNINIVAQDGFNYEGLENPAKDTDIFASMDGWSNVASPMTTASQIKTDVNGNKYAEFGFNAANGARIDWNKTATGNKVKLDFDMMLTPGDNTWSASYLLATLKGTNAGGEEVTAQVQLAHIAPDGWLYWGYADNDEDFIHLNSLKMLPVSIELDLENKNLVSTLVGGERPGYQGESYTEEMVGFQSVDTDIINAAGNTFTTVSAIRFISNGSHNIDVDNFVLSTEVEEINDDVIGALKVKVDGNKKQINVTSQYDEEHTLTQAFYVRTDTNQHMEYIDQYLTDSNGNITKLWENDNYYRSTYPNDESAPLLINYRYFGGNHSTGCVVLTKAGHGKTLADVGTLWKDASGNRWVLAEVTDANRVKFVWAEPLPVGSFELYTYVDGGASSGTLTRWENDAATGDTFAYTSQYGGQLFPIVKNSQQTVVAYNEDGTSVDVDLGTSQILGAHKVVITDSYDITDPTAVAMSLYNNRPDGGYTEANRPNYAPGETVVAYKQIITIMDDGTVLTEFDHEVKQELKMLTYFGIQYYMRSNLGGGVKRLMPGTKAFSATRSIYAHRDSISEDTSRVYDFDFSVPTQLYREEKGLVGTPQEHYMFNLPHYKVFNNTTWANENIVPNRVIDFMYDSGNNSDIAYAAGFLPVMDAAHDVRLQNTTISFDVDGKAKAYPYLISTNRGEKLQPGGRIQGVAYRKFEDADRFDGKASVYSIPYNDKDYYYVDMLEDGSVTFAVEGVTEEKVTVSQNVGDATVTVADGTITVAGDKKDYVELTISWSGSGEGGGNVTPEVPDTPDVQDSNATITTDENGTKVAYKLNNIPASQSAVLVAALIEKTTGDVKEINWTACDDISLLQGDTKQIEVTLTGTESSTVELHYYLCNNLNEFKSLNDFAPSEPELKTVDAQISNATLNWAAPDDDYDNSSDLRYNIYDDGLLVNELPISALNFNVLNLVPGANYHFFVKALDSKNNESNVSNMVKGRTYMPSTVNTRIKPIEDADLAISKDGNLAYGALPSVLDTTLFYYKQDKAGGLNCFSSTACYQGTATGTPNYIRGLSYLSFQLNNPVNADNITYAYEFTYYDQHEETGQDANLVMTYCTTRGRKDIRVKLENDKAWKTVKGTFTAEKPLTVIGDGSARQSQIMFSNSHPFKTEWCEDRPASGGSLQFENLYDEDYTKIYRMTLIPLVNGADAVYNNYNKLAGASLTIENPADGEAATIISGLDSNAKGFNSDSEDKKLVEKDNRLAVALGDLNDTLTFTVKDTSVVGKQGNIEICCFAEEETVVRLSDGSTKTIPAKTWTKIRFAQSSVSNSQYSITANNELYVSSLRVTAK